MIHEQPFPDSGWVRIDDSSKDIKYTGTFESSNNYVHPYNSTFTSSKVKGDKFEFSFQGTGLRIISRIRNDRSNLIEIFIDGVMESYSEYGKNEAERYGIVYEKNGLPNGLHHVVVINKTSNLFGLDAYDFVSGPSNKYLLKLNNGEYRKYNYGIIEKETAIPQLTNNTTPSGKAFASNFNRNYDAYYAFNTVTYRFQTAIGSGGVGFLGYEFDDKIIVLKYGINSISNSSDLNEMPKDWTFEGSNDGVSWNVLDVQKDQIWELKNSTKEYIINSPKEYKIYRLNWTANNGNVHYTSIQDLKMYSGIYINEWELVSDTVLIQKTFTLHGMTDLSIIPPEAWQELAQLSPTVEIVTYVPEGNKVQSFTETYMDIPLRIDMKALPFEQLVVQPSDFELHGSLLAIIANQLPVQAYEGRCQFILSFDGGVTWEVFRNGRWKSVNAADMAKVRELGMSFKALARIKETHFQDKGSQLRIGYYLDDSIHREEETKLDHSRLVARSALDDVKVKDLSLSLLNTKASIELKLTGNKLTGRLDDPDKGKVQYRVLLNDKPYFPANGEFTRLAASPVDINLTISERDIVFNQENKLRVEYQDYWGETESWETKFIGSYSGLMFMDETGNYYSDTFGGILKYLDFDMLIAGQTSLDQKVVVKNQLGYSITNLTLKTVNESLPDGVAIELSRKSSPFIPVDSLLYSEVLHQGDTVECYVRIATEIDAKPTPDGRFEIRAYANRI